MADDKRQILLYQTLDGESRIDVRLQGETALALTKWQSYFSVISPLFPDITKIYLRRENYSRMQPLRFLQQIVLLFLCTYIRNAV